METASVLSPFSLAQDNAMTKQRNSIGLVELSSIAAGFQAADTMLKAANVDLLLNRTICSGKYMVLVGGDVAAVQASVAAGVAVAGTSVIDSCVIANIHSAVFPAISGNVIAPRSGALGILEAFSVAALIEGADAAVKTADVQLLEVRLAMAMGGKAFVKMTGSVASVEAGIEAGAQCIAQRGLLVNKVVIPAPAPEILGETL
jgi:microcompartment protein CcmL/EutN